MKPVQNTARTAARWSLAAVMIMLVVVPILITALIFWIWIHLPEFEPLEYCRA